MKRKNAVLPALLYLASLSASAAGIGVPAPMAEGDAWTYRIADAGKAASQVVYQIGHRTPNGTFIVMAAPPAQPGRQQVWQMSGFVGADVCIYDLPGRDKLALERSCDAALSPGSAWNSKTADSLQSVEDAYVVKAVEEVEVPAGRFQAVKIENRRTITEVAYPGVAAPANGYVTRTVNVFWYAPAVRGIVKASRQTTAENGTVIVDARQELERFSAGSGKG